MRILITGARGRLGTFLRGFLVAAGHEVVAFSRRAGDHFSSLDDLSDNLRLGADVVIHLAWSTFPATSGIARGAEWRDDLPLLSSILGQCADYSKTTSRGPLLVFFSSCSVYGALSPETSRAFKETDTVNPRGWYAAGKVAAENLINLFGDYELNALILRVSNPFGFTQGTQRLQGIVPAALQAAQQGRELPIWGDGSALKDFLDVRDLANAVCRALECRLTGTFNICSGREYSIRETLQLIEKCIQKTIKVTNLPSAPWDVLYARYSNHCFQKATGWRPKIPFEVGLRDYIAHAIQSPETR